MGLLELDARTAICRRPDLQVRELRLCMVNIRRNQSCDANTNTACSNPAGDEITDY